MSLNLSILKDTYAILKFDDENAIPDWVEDE